MTALHTAFSTMHAPCQISIFTTSAGYLFQVVGRASLRESPALRDFVQNALDDGADVVVDLSQCAHMDSTFLGCLVLLHQHSESTKGVFSVYADQSMRRVLFGTSHLDLVLPFAAEPVACHGQPVRLAVMDLKGKQLCEHLVETHRQLADLGGPSAETFQRIVERLLQELKQLPP